MKPDLYIFDGYFQYLGHFPVIEFQFVGKDEYRSVGIGQKVHLALNASTHLVLFQLFL